MQRDEVRTRDNACLSSVDAMTEKTQADDDETEHEYGMPQQKRQRRLWGYEDLDCQRPSLSICRRCPRGSTIRYAAPCNAAKGQCSDYSYGTS